jgi:hypothetical protein
MGIEKITTYELGGERRRIEIPENIKRMINVYSELICDNHPLYPNDVGNKQQIIEFSYNRVEILLRESQDIAETLLNITTFYGIEINFLLNTRS